MMKVTIDFLVRAAAKEASRRRRSGTSTEVIATTNSRRTLSLTSFSDSRTKL